MLDEALQIRQRHLHQGNQLVGDTHDSIARVAVLQSELKAGAEHCRAALEVPAATHTHTVTSHTHNLSLSLSLSHVHTHTHTRCYMRACTDAQWRPIISIGAADQEEQEELRRKLLLLLLPPPQTHTHTHSHTSHTHATSVADAASSFPRNASHGVNRTPLSIHRSID